MSPWLSKHAAAAASKPSSSAEAHEAGAGAGPFPSSEQQRSPGDNSSNGDGRNMYSLRAIVMHVGGPSVGHYYAYVRQMTAQRRGAGGKQATRRRGGGSTKEGAGSAEQATTAVNRWVKLDDSRVSEVSESEVLRDAFGGSGGGGFPGLFGQVRNDLSVMVR